MLLVAIAIIAAPAGGLARLAASEPFLPPSFAHPFGTDDLGRDMFRAVAEGLRTSILVGVGATVMAFAAGVAIGLAAGWGHGSRTRRRCASPTSSRACRCCSPPSWSRRCSAARSATSSSCSA